MKDARAYAKERAESRERLRNKQAAEDLAALLKLPEFRRFVIGQFDFSKVFGNEFNQDARQHAYNSGMRFVGQRLLDSIGHVSPPAVLEIMREKYETEVKEAQQKQLDLDNYKPNRHE